MEVEKLKKKDIDSYVNFIKEIFDYDISRDNVENMRNKNIVLVIKDDERVVASVMLEERFEYIKNQKYYFVSYLGVKKEYRRRGYATKLFDEIKNLVSKNSIEYLELTSGNQRIGAHHFYRSKNFKVKDTTVFVKVY